MRRIILVRVPKTHCERLVKITRQTGTTQGRRVLGSFPLRILYPQVVDWLDLMTYLGV